MLLLKGWSKASSASAGACLVGLLSGGLWFVSVKAKESKHTLERFGQATVERSKTTQIAHLKPKRLQANELGMDVATAKARWRRDGIEISARLGELVLTCWSATEESQRYAGEGISRVAVLIPTNTQSETEFDFCVEAIRFGDQDVVWSEEGTIRSEDNQRLTLTGHWSAFGDAHTRWEGSGAGPRLSHAVPTGGPVCVKGVAPRVSGNLHSEYWGAGLGLNLFPGDRLELTEPSFDEIRVFLSGNHIPKHLRLSIDNESNADGSGQYWCLNVDTD